MLGSLIWVFYIEYIYKMQEYNIYSIKLLEQKCLVHDVTCVKITYGLALVRSLFFINGRLNF